MWFRTDLRSRKERTELRSTALPCMSVVFRKWRLHQKYRKLCFVLRMLTEMDRYVTRSLNLLWISTFSKEIYFLGGCCEIPDPPPNFGDPHLETMDGVSFDYFGIGQFWFCLSQANDFGIQTRFFYFGQTSFTGAVAAKIANSVLTLTTPPGGAHVKPQLRYCYLLLYFFFAK